jgi:D-beta-D-heptose 7-phosphate kinase/D-beta-D-heptose 1-phosphate adenosyltransferase
VKKVLVIGDGCKDVFQYGKCDRLSPEAPVPVFKPTKNKENGGMAVNVYNNLIALGVDCDILTNSGITKTRYVDEICNQMLLRVDENDEVPQLMLADLKKFCLEDYDAIVVSDYNKGFLTEEIILYLAENHHMVFMDTKKDLHTWCNDIFCIKINQKEYDRNANELQWYYKYNLVVTAGGKGAMYSNKSKKIAPYLIPIIEDHPVRDLTGAGDTFLAALVAKYLETQNMVKAIEFANKCASWVVTQKGVVTVDLNKIKI